jgi:hypothetical protein
VRAATARRRTVKAIERGVLGAERGVLTAMVKETLNLYLSPGLLY